MSNPTYKTIADIVAEKRARANEIEGAAGRDANQFQRELIADLRAEADELEAAAKRERERVEAEALTVGGMVEAARKPAGNEAAMREVIVAIRKAMVLDSGYGPTTEFHSVVDTLTQAALEKPARNCDRVDSIKQAKALYRAEVRTVMVWDGYESERFEKWLLAPATKQKGGNDGSK